MTPERQYIRTLLQDLRAELQAQDLWAHLPPEPQAFESTEPFSIDTMSLENWLQYIFIARVEAILDQGTTLPETCAVEPYAQKQFAARLHSHELLRIIGKLDIMITRAV